MLANGWCPRQIDHLSHKHDAQTLSYLATLERSSLRTTAAGVDHARCSSDLPCTAHNSSDMSQYRTRHTERGRECSMVEMPREQLARVLESGGVPLIAIEGSDGADGACRLTVHARSIGIKYVAISHVWADGLGNPGGNALPLCQIRKLRGMLRDLGSLLNGDQPYE
ncbi:hypothetical protein MN608_05509 [Microdochium nivale]|nr:hypothetical protein MN608_05509 [Microdochium nivale]